MTTSCDVLMCVNTPDIEYLFKYALQSCRRNFEPLKDIFLVTPDAMKLRAKLRTMDTSGTQITLLEDREVLDDEAMSLPGWLRQQLIKLQADEICASSSVTCLGSDSVILRSIRHEDIFKKGSPILYFNRYKLPSDHLNYERRRIEHVASLLKVTPKRSLLLGDFIMELMTFDCSTLRSLRAYLRRLYPAKTLARIIDRRCESMADKVRFGEWSLYSVYVLDHLNADVDVRNSEGKFLRHLHSANDLERFGFDAQVVHFVDKRFDMKSILRRLSDMGAF